MPLPHTVSELEIENGAKGLLIDVPGASVLCYEFNFRAGNEFVRDEKIQQTAHILEHMALKATKQYPTSEQYSQAFSRNGAYNNASTWETDMAYYGDCADMEWERVLDLQRQALVEPLFLENEFAAEKRNVYEELAGQSNNHARILWQNISRAVGGTSLLDKEKITTIEAVTLDDIREHHIRTHTTSNMRFVIAGDVAERRDTIKELIGAWQLPRGEGRLEPKQVKPKRGELVVLERSEVDGLRFGLSLELGRKLAHHEEMLVEAINHLLNGTFHSRMFGQARTRGLCYSMASDISVNYDGTSSWSFGGQVSENNADELMKLVAEQLRAVAAGEISQTEVDDAIAYGLGSFQKSNQTAGALAGTYGGDYFADETIHLLETAPDRIKSIDQKSLTKLAQEFLSSGFWGFGVIGNVTQDHAQDLETIIAGAFSKEVS